MKITAPVILGCFVLTTNLSAQDLTTRLPELEVMTGSWNVTAEARLSAAGPWETNKGKSIIVRTTGAVVIEEDYTGILQKKSFTTKSIIAFDHFTNKFQRVFIDSEHGTLVDYEGVKRGDSLIFDKTWVYPNKSTVKLRVVYTFISPDEFRTENMRMPENSTTWDITGRMKYLRIK